MQAHGESLNLFTDELVNKAITQAQYVDHLPVSQSANGFIEFNITSQNFIDLSRSQLYLKCKVVNGDNHEIGNVIHPVGTPKANEDEDDPSQGTKAEQERDIIPTNCLLGGLFQKVDLTVQQKIFLMMFKHLLIHINIW